ncbi:MAG: glycosyltransferase [Cellulosilyticum sp.]|nr:glycosyltransferase [Cellulosilyticum sp.]
MTVSFERARNNEWTCKVHSDNNKEQYVYSKYRPKESIKIENEIKEDKNYIILGLGLGYEVEYIANRTKGIVYVIEPNETYLEFIMSQEELRCGIEKENIKILIGNKYEEVEMTQLIKCELISNTNLMKYEISYFSKFIKWLHEAADKIDKRILVIDHCTIAKDCINTFKNLGYRINIMPEWLNREKLIKEIDQFRPDYVFTINFEAIIATICEAYRIPYISWTVDTPLYDLYEREVGLSYSIKFIYDKSIVEHLRERGIKNVYHLPVAVDSKRMKEMICLIDDKDRIRYGCDVGFVANLTKSEYSENLAPYMQREDIEYINQMVEEQHKDTSIFTIKYRVRESLLEQFKNKYIIQVKNRPYIDYEDSIAFLIGRYHSEVERVKFSQSFNKYFNTKVFGNENWKDYISCYAGHAEHYTEMPKAFHLAKINLNMTRCFVESGLPMRVFDVLGAQGFLLTNYKPELEELFNIGKDLVVYRDLQDALDIAEYYLHHEEERQEITRNGHETVLEKHTYEQRIKQMMKKVEMFVEKLKR